MNRMIDGYDNMENEPKHNGVYKGTILRELGEDAGREEPLPYTTPGTKAMQLITKGYKETTQDEHHEEIMMVKDIEMFSLCDHHLVPYFWQDFFKTSFPPQVHIAYIPNKKVVGLSKLASHMCVVMTDVQKINASTVTGVMLGKFHDDATTRKEFLSITMSQ